MKTVPISNLLLKNPAYCQCPSEQALTPPGHVNDKLAKQFTIICK